MGSTTLAFKYNSFVVSLYNAFLNNLCRGVEAFIFVASTGRCGTVSLADILRAADKAICLHEPYPTMINLFAEPHTFQKDFEYRFNTRKRINVKQAAVGFRYYIETNHLFINNFACYAAKEFGRKLKVIHLRRDPVKVATSFFRINSIPGITPRGKEYLLDPLNKNNIVLLTDLFQGNSEFNHPLYRCLWYWYEVEARIWYFKNQFPQISTYRLSTEELNEETKLTDMFNTLGIEYDQDELLKRVGTHANSRNWEKNITDDIRAASEMNENLMNIISSRYQLNFLEK